MIVECGTSFRRVFHPVVLAVVPPRHPMVGIVGVNGIVQSIEGGQLTNAVAEKPFSVLLFDEIENVGKLVSF
mgnify:CR=1 FL=1